MKSYQTTLLLTIIMALLAGMGFAQDSASLKRAPLNPDFIQYVKEREEGKLITRTRDGYPLTDIYLAAFIIKIPSYKFIKMI